MCNKEHLVGFLYGELSGTDRLAFEAHLKQCAACRDEVGQLRQTRQHLEAWSPPEPEFNFQIVHTVPSVAKPARRFAAIPQWALTAAASLLLVAGAAAIANVEVRRDTDGAFAIRTGWSSLPAVEPEGRVAAPTAAVQAAQAVASTASSEQLERQVLALMERVAELESVQGNQTVRAAVAARPGIAAPELRKILAESEARQRTEMTVYMQQMWKDFNAARASDLARVQQALGQAQGLTNIQLRQQRDTIDSLRYLHAVSQQK